MVPVSTLWAGWWSGVQLPVGMLYHVWSSKTASGAHWASYLVGIHGSFPMVNLTRTWSWPLPSSAKDIINFGWNEALNEITLYPHCTLSSHLCLRYAVCVVYWLLQTYKSIFFFILVSYLLCTAHCCKLRYVVCNFQFSNILYNSYCMLILLWWCVWNTQTFFPCLYEEAIHWRCVSNHRFSHY
jgi:hypothetical protein